MLLKPTRHPKDLSLSRIRKKIKACCYWLMPACFMSLFQPMNFLMKTQPALVLRKIELNKNYALILNTNAGLWGYSIGDTVKFVSKNPYKILVTGRIKHYISAFGEHVIGEEVEQALMGVAKKKD
jgi:acyl-CoA synthetase (AMP-forming)/AMP-acid ligase II